MKGDSSTANCFTSHIGTGSNLQFLQCLMDESLNSRGVNRLKGTESRLAVQVSKARLISSYCRLSDTVNLGSKRFRKRLSVETVSSI